ncbi:DUF2017 domain-containing protein [Phytoactinopolyspora alkaliphila]|uniref:DUF2017 domain-containing protein n=1 Tax=Phytoactinopolyspora alkaliphila TaxID=1783498 RepID=A0A6N9YMI6_9ACTN|nr:DUF2017 domain-containing protein [Phytoactinopolyspora alkaliphila]NED96182.1 DUF2017 domain-containing protein [Phytoactinopolyspora alkaliphila]
MSTAFRRTRGGGVTASFHTAEVELLRSLVGQLLELVRDESEAKQEDEGWAVALGLADDEPVRPTDPVLLRLFPDGYQEDGEAAADFRKFTERGLREAKAGTAATVLASLATAEGVDPGERKSRDKIRVELDAAEADAWLRTLTDLRLALGTRLGVSEGDEDVWAALPEDDPRRHIHDVYDWLGWLQETLVRTLSAGLG